MRGTTFRVKKTASNITASNSVNVLKLCGKMKAERGRMNQKNRTWARQTSSRQQLWI